MSRSSSVGTPEGPTGRLPDWITDPALRPVWAVVRDALERRGLAATGRVRCDLADRGVRHAAGALLGRVVTSSRVQIDLADLDARLRERSGVGGLVEVVAAVSEAPLVDRPGVRQARAAAREAPLALARDLLADPELASWTAGWSADFVVGLRRTGLLSGRPDAVQAVRDAVAVLAAVHDTVHDGVRDGERTAARVELAARVLGDAHGLDDDRLGAQLVLRALAAASGVPAPTTAVERHALWERYAVLPDRVSRTCLVLGLWLDAPAVRSASGVAARWRAAADDGDPVHVTGRDLARVASFGDQRGVDVLVCENPRVLEAMADRRTAGGGDGGDRSVVVCTAGEPNLIVLDVLGRLRDAGARLRHHGDFDWPGLAIVGRLVARLGSEPWLMSADDYLRGVRPGAPPLVGAPLEAAWDPDLVAAMRHHGVAVHEETVLEGLIRAWTQRS